MVNILGGLIVLIWSKTSFSTAKKNVLMRNNKALTKIILKTVFYFQKDKQIKRNVTKQNERLL